MGHLSAMPSARRVFSLLPVCQGSSFQAVTAGLPVQVSLFPAGSNPGGRKQTGEVLPLGE